jgi:alkanesulfonate monooxygenase SsuD/methylene tetrahydromethanopterin reductase-like flavin-dependent oxidoreductase (luciferase family)
VKSVRAEAAKNGREPSSIKFFAGISPIIGRTQEEPEAKFEAWRENIDVIGGLAKFSGYTNIDMSVFPLDEPFEFKGEPQENTIQGIVNNFKAGYLDNKPWTPRRLGEKMAFGSLVGALIFPGSNNTYSKIFSVSNASRNRLNGSRCL